MKFKKALIGVMTAAVLVSSVFFGACKEEENKPPVVVPPAVEKPTRTVEETKVTVYDGPSLLQSSEMLDAYVEDRELFVYDTRVNHGRIHKWDQVSTENQVVNFDFEGKVHIKIQINKATAQIDKNSTVYDVVSVTDVVVRPLCYDIKPTVSENVIEFDLEYSANYTLEYKAMYDKNGVLTANVEDGADNALHIFANPIETDPITEEQAAKDDKIVYIGPGIYSAGAIPMSSGQTLYLAGGAYVYGNIRASGLENITIRGRGIISGEIYNRRQDAERTLPIELQKCKNVKIEGITMLDPAGWAVTLYMCENVTLDNVKMITARSNGDGISVQSSKNVTVKGGFVRTWDDSLVVKNSDRGTTSEVTFDGVTVWTDLAQSMEVGYETYGATMDKITFKNITVLHNYHKAAMSIHNCDDAVITNVLYQSITIEDAQMLGDNRNSTEDDFLIDMTIAFHATWTKSGGDRGSIKGVTFDNIKILNMADSIVCHLDGENDKSSISNVLIQGVEIEGNRIKTEEALKLLKNQYAKGITVREGDYDVFGAGVAYPYELKLKEGDTPEVTSVTTKKQSGIEVPEFAILDIPESFMGVKKELPSTTTFSVNRGKGEDALPASAPDYTVTADSGNNISKLFDGDRKTAFIADEWQGIDNEYISITVDFGEVVSPGVIRFYLDESNPYLNNVKFSVFTKYSATVDEDGNPFVNNDGTVVPEVALDTKTGEPKFKQLKKNGKNVWKTDENGNEILDANGQKIPVVDTWTPASFGMQFNVTEYSFSPASGNYFDVQLPATLKCNALQLRFFRTEGLSGQEKLQINEISFFPSSLSTQQKIEDSTPHYDVYPNTNIVDGNESTYYESVRLWEDNKNATAFITVDLGEVYDVKYIIMHLPKSLAWETRTQEIEIQVSTDGRNFTTAVAKNAYTFNPLEGNSQSVELSTPAKARYVKLVFHSNTAGYGAQLSELYVYGS